MTTGIEKRTQHTLPVADENDALTDDIDDNKATTGNVLFAPDAVPTPVEDAFTLEFENLGRVVVGANERPWSRSCLPCIGVFVCTHVAILVWFWWDRPRCCYPVVLALWYRYLKPIRSHQR